MRRSSLLILLSALLSGLLSPASLAADASEWFSRMSKVAAQQSFRGTFIYERSGIFSTHRIWHMAQGSAPSRERLLQLDGQEQEVVLSNGQISCATADLMEHLTGRQDGAGRKLDVSRLVKTYELKMLGNSRVAGRPAMALLLLPRDADRYARELHLDTQTGLPLKSLLLNQQGQLLERLQFTSLFPSQLIADQDLQPVTACRPPSAAAKKPDVASPWQAAWIPAGFVQVGTLERSGAVSGKPVQSLLFDDGLASFSIFIESLADAQVDTAHTQVGPTVVVSRPVSNAGGHFMATVVGEIPLATAQRIALSISSKQITGGKP